MQLSVSSKKRMNQVSVTTSLHRFNFRSLLLAFDQEVATTSDMLVVPYDEIVPHMKSDEERVKAVTVAISLQSFLNKMLDQLSRKRIRNKSTFSVRQACLRMMAVDLRVCCS
jgi:hypothetical protein